MVILYLVLLFLFGFSLFLYQESTGVVVERVKIYTGFTPKETIRCLHLSDLHFQGRGRVERQVLKHIKELHPQLIFLTGDYLSRPERKEEFSAFLKEFPPGMKMYAVRGDHDYRFPDLKSFFSQVGITLLSNQETFLEVEEMPLHILGLECKEMLPPEFLHSSSFLPQKEAFTIALSHTYQVVESLAGRGIHLYLVGDTHGGQIHLPLVGRRILQALFGMKYLKGEYCLGSSILYVNRGLGRVILPFRIGSRPEITLLELE